MLDIGAQGGSNDAAILADSPIGNIFENNPTLFNIPEPSLNWDVFEAMVHETGTFWFFPASR
jgi:hypothetical protein